MSWFVSNATATSCAEAEGIMCTVSMSWPIYGKCIVHELFTGTLLSLADDVNMGTYHMLHDHALMHPKPQN